MSAVQLLEQLGADAKLRDKASVIFQEQFPGASSDNEQSKIWCLLMPEKDEEESEDTNEEEIRH